MHIFSLQDSVDVGILAQREEQMHIFSLQDPVDVGTLANLLKWSNFHIRRAALQNQNQTHVYSCYSHQFSVTKSNKIFLPKAKIH